MKLVLIIYPKYIFCNFINELLNLHHDELTLGSNSIKDVVPVILSTSEFLKSKCASEIYGYEKNIHSLNFSSIAWIQSNQSGYIKDPYSLLPSLLTEFDNEEVEKYGEDEEVRNHGGAAMLAYSTGTVTLILTRLK